MSDRPPEDRPTKGHDNDDPQTRTDDLGRWTWDKDDVVWERSPRDPNLPPVIQP